MLALYKYVVQYWTSICLNPTDACDLPESILECNSLWFHRGVEKRKAEIALLKADWADLESQSLRLSIQIQNSIGFFAMEAAGELKRARFKLNFKQEEQEQFRVQQMPEVKPVRPGR